MKHLKKFNESYERKEELKDFCETHLAYLLDEGYEIFIKKDRDNSLLLSLTIDKNDEDYTEFKWNDIKDHFIPFLTHLSNNYEINGNVQLTTNRPNRTSKTFPFNYYEFYTIQEMIDDKPVELDCCLYEIEMSIK